MSTSIQEIEITFQNRKQAFLARMEIETHTMESLIFKIDEAAGGNSLQLQSTCHVHCYSDIF